MINASKERERRYEGEAPAVRRACRRINPTHVVREQSA
jgi:hypothetical protein